MSSASSCRIVLFRFQLNDAEEMWFFREEASKARDRSENKKERERHKWEEADCDCLEDAYG